MPSGDKAIEGQITCGELYSWGRDAVLWGPIGHRSVRDGCSERQWWYRHEARCWKRGVGESDGLGNRSDTSRGHRDQPGIPNRMDTSGDAMQTISTQRDAAKLFNSPVKLAGWPINDEGKSRNHANTPNMRAGEESVENHANTAGNTQELSARTADPEPPDIPASSTGSCTEKADGPESCPGTLSARIHVHGDGNGSRRPGNASKILDLSARSTKSHTGEPVRLRSRTDTSTHAPSDANDSKMAVKASKTPKRAHCANHTR